MHADLALENAAMKDVISKSGDAVGPQIGGLRVEVRLPANE